MAEKQVRFPSLDLKDSDCFSFFYHKVRVIDASNANLHNLELLTKLEHEFGEQLNDICLKLKQKYFPQVDWDNSGEVGWDQDDLREEMKLKALCDFPEVESYD